MIPSPKTIGRIVPRGNLGGLNMVVSFPGEKTGNEVQQDTEERHEKTYQGQKSCQRLPFLGTQVGAPETPANEERPDNGYYYIYRLHQVVLSSQMR